MKCETKDVFHGKIHFARIHGGDFARIQNGEFARNVSLNLVSEIKLMGTAFAPKIFFPSLAKPVWLHG